MEDTIDITSYSSEELEEYFVSITNETQKIVLKELSANSYPQFKDLFLKLLASNPSGSIKQYLIIALGKIPDPSVAEKLIELYYHESNEKIRKSILIALGRNENKTNKVFTTFIGAIEEDNYPTNRITAAKYLHKVFGDETVEFLLYHHSIESEQNVKDQISDIVNSFAEKHKLEFESEIELFDVVDNFIEYNYIVNIMTNSAEFDSDSIVYALSAFPDYCTKEDIVYIVNLIESTRNAKIKISCYKVIERIGDSSLIKLLIAQFRNESLNKDVRVAIVNALISIWDNREPDEVVELLRNESNVRVRLRLFDLIYTSSGYNREILPFLKDLSLTDNSKKIRSKAAKLYTHLNKPFLTQELAVSDGEIEVKDIFQKTDAEDQGSSFDLITPDPLVIEKELMIEEWTEVLIEDIPLEVRTIASKSSIGKTTTREELELLAEYGFLESHGKIVDFVGDDYYIREKSIDEDIIDILAKSTASIYDLADKLKLMPITILKQLRSFTTFFYKNLHDDYPNIYCIKKVMIDEEINYEAKDIPYKARKLDPLLMTSMLCYDFGELENEIIVINEPTKSQLQIVAKNLSIFWNDEDIMQELVNNKDISLIKTHYGYLPKINNENVVIEIREKILDIYFEKDNAEIKAANRKLNDLLSEVYTEDELNLQKILRWNLVFGQICNVYKRYNLEMDKLTAIRNVLLETIITGLDSYDRIRILKQDEMFERVRIPRSKSIIKT